MTEYAPPRAEATLDDKYTLEQGVVFMTGIQALVRLPIEQRRRDRTAGHRTAGYVSGYQGSPLAAIDGALRKAHAQLEAHDVVFRPGVNEELAATAVHGTQYVGMFPGARYDGVFGIWYGKGPGVDRSVDALRHANWAGTSRLGGMLVLAGDDHGAKSSTVACYSDIVFESCGMPVLYPSTTQEILDFGLHGIALSRFSSLAVGMKLVTDVVESAGPVSLTPDAPPIVEPDDFTPPPGGLAIRPYEMALLPVEERLYHERLYAALAYIRANRLNRVTLPAAGATVGIVTAGKAHQDVQGALAVLGLDAARAEALGVRVLKLGVVWPVEPTVVRDFAQGLQTLVVVEEKRPLIEAQLRSILYGQPGAPAILGKVRSGHLYDPQPDWLFPNFGETSPTMVARLLAHLLASRDPALASRLPEPAPSEGLPAPIARTPSFCSGCPHNRSTRLPAGSRALAGIGCHGMQVFLDPENCKTVAQMGGEGMHWMGQAPFTSETHVFANIGDGTFAHSGSLAIRQAVAFDARITYKLLVNGFVSMTGGQTIAGGQSVPRIVEGLLAEGVRKIVVVTDDLDKYAGVRLPADVPLEHRSQMERVQKELREYPGVSVIVYEQPCATERRRLRKQGKWEDPAKRTFINHRVCEGCGDCGKASTCLSIEPRETPFGRKRQINQSSCNKDFSCIEGFCPSFVTVHGGKLRGPDRRDARLQPFEVPQPERPVLSGTYSVLVGGIGGTGVVTVGQVLAMAAHIDGTPCLSLDVMGMAQKYGAVFSHLNFASDTGKLNAARIGIGQTDALIGCDLIVASGHEPTATLAPGRSKAVLCADVIATAEFARDADWTASPETLIERIERVVGAEALTTVDGQRLAVGLLGDAVASNMMMVGVAWQKRLIPLSLAAIRRAIELNGVQVPMNLASFEWGRCIADDPQRVERMLQGGQVVTFHPRRTEQPLPERIESFKTELTAYGGAALARRYARFVEAARQADPAPDGQPSFTAAVAASYYKLLAVKDEWEVARLHASPAFIQEIAATFEGDFELHFHVGAWPFARTDPVTGRPVKRELGPWLMNAFRLMARMRRLRGTWLDPFRHNAERALDRRLLAQFEADMPKLQSSLRADNYETAVAIARLPERIRGYGHVRVAHAEQADAERRRLLQRLEAPRIVEVVRQVG